VPPGRHSPAATTEVEVVPVALTQSEGDASSAGTPEPREAHAKSWTPGRVGRNQNRGRRVGCGGCHQSRQQRSHEGSGGLTAWGGGRTANLSSLGGLTANLCSGRDRTPRTCGLSASYGQRWKARGNTGRRQWCGHGSHAERVVLQKNV
jgi:hypothetical protein